MLSYLKKTVILLITSRLGDEVSRKKNDVIEM